MARGGSAKIGALHVALGLDSAQFNSGINKAEGGLGKFGKTAGIALAAVATAAVAAGAALGVAVKGAIDHADELSKTAQKIGVATEALSRLEWAAKLSDVSLEQMSTGLRKLSQNMLEVSQGRGAQAESSFAALGISVTDATGALKSADEVMTEVADKFSRMEDGSVKTALAMNIFGRAGTQMIPMLNMGRQGLADMAAESDRLGQTISGETGRAAEEFNDSLTRLDAVFSGIVNRIMVQALPALNNLTGTLSDPGFQSAISNTTTLFVGLADVIARTVMLAGALVDILPKAVNANEDAQVMLIPGQEEMYAAAEAGMAGHNGTGAGAGTFSGMQALMGISSGADGAGTPFVPNIIPAIEGVGKAAKTAQEAIDPFAARMQELSGVLTQTHDPFEQMKMDLDDLRTMWEEGRIGVEQYQNAVMQTQLNTAAATLGMVGQLSGAFANLFKDNKAFAIANAVINTAEGITKALAQGGMFGYIGAAAVAASGAAQIATIMSANPGGGSSVKAPSASGAAAPQASTGHNVNVTLHGTSFGRDQIRELLDQINDYQADGGTRIMVNAA